MISLITVAWRGYLAQQMVSYRIVSPFLMRMTVLQDCCYKASLCPKINYVLCSSSDRPGATRPIVPSLGLTGSFGCLPRPTLVGLQTRHNSNCRIVSHIFALIRQMSPVTRLYTAALYDTIRYGRLTCAQKIARWSAESSARPRNEK